MYAPRAHPVSSMVLPVSLLVERLLPVKKMSLRKLRRLRKTLVIGKIAIMKHYRDKMPLSIGRAFGMGTTWKFLPFIAVASLLVVIIYFVMSDYSSLHFRNKKRIVLEALFRHIRIT